jgi:hypothetical protein
VIYNYTKEILSDKLKAEILVASLPLQKINTLGTAVTITMTETLSEAQETSLNAIVDAHTNALTQKEKDIIRFQKRAASKADLISEMAADNMERVRNEIWTVAQLIALIEEAEIKDLLGAIESLSFEVAHSKVDGLTSSLLTTDIKTDWKAKISSRFFIEA